MPSSAGQNENPTSGGENEDVRPAIPTLGSLRIGELTVPAIERALASIRSRHEPQAARAARRTLSSRAHYAARHGALSVNPCATPVRSPARANASAH